MILFYLLTYFVCGAYALLMIAYLIGWNRTQVQSSIVNHQPSTIISVIIPARNEERSILNCLSAIYKQSYPVSHFEIIVVDDHSSDRTAEFIYQLDIPNLKLFQLSESQSGKKQAINEGIKNASGTLIITTDADCEMGEKWLSSIVSFYEKEKPKMIVAPVLLKENFLSEKEEKSFLYKMQSQEMIALTACACASLYYNLPILCSGANLIYEKEAFTSVNGFEGVDATATGDDVFLMLKMHEKYPKQIKYLKSNNAAVFTNPEKKISSVIAQRKRWASKTFHYGYSHVTWVAVLIFMANFFVFLSVPVAIGISVINPVGYWFLSNGVNPEGIISNGINAKFALALLTTLPIKSIVDYMLINSANSFFNKRIHPFAFMLASLLYPVYASLLGLISPFTNYSWKGRKS